MLGHNVLLIGPPVSSKTMLARRLPGLLPPLSRKEAIAVTKVHSLAAESPPLGRVTACPALGLSARAYGLILKVARTLAV